MNINNLNKDMLICNIKISYSLNEVFIRCGMPSNQISYKLIRDFIKSENLSTKHFLHRNGVLKSPIRSLKQILVKNSKEIFSSKLKTRVIKSGLLKNKCYECGLTEWRNKPITLQIDHKNGDRYDHRIKNLQLICPNCHSQTETFCGKNIKNNQYDTDIYKGKNNKSLKDKCSCGKDKCVGAKLCSICWKATNRNKIEWKDVEVLKKEILESSMTALSKKLKVSQTAIKKHLMKLGVKFKRGKPI